MVDPDNRRRVDFEERREALAALDSGAPVDRTNIKLHVIRRALALRSRRPEPFAGTYNPLPADDRLCAFTRGDSEILTVIALREDAAGATFTLPAGATGEWRNALADSGPSADASPITLGTQAFFEAVRFGDWPVALLERSR
jgi:(1->4)-alpha-D-glucan 1-alpha-D-glucosylmutase